MVGRLARTTGITRCYSSCIEAIELSPMIAVGTAARLRPPTATTWRRPGKQSSADQRGAPSHGEDGGQSARPSKGSVRWFAISAGRESFAILSRFGVGAFLRL